MKIEKVNENKIRIILNIDDLEKNNVDFKSVLNNSYESQNLLLKILNRAEIECGFYTNNCKILIEAFNFPSGNLVFTITKFLSDTPKTLSKNRILRFKSNKFNLLHKKELVDESTSIYRFAEFNDFFMFCNSFGNVSLKNINCALNESVLYIYNGTYYLVIPRNNKLLDSVICEFAEKLETSTIFINNLHEYGKIVLKSNSLKQCIYQLSMYFK